MVTYIRSDLDFILAQIKIAEAHAAGTQPLFGENGLIPAYNLSLGLRTVDGTYNHLLPGQERWGAADSQFPTLLNPSYRPADGPVDMDGPGPTPPMGALNYNPSNDPNSLVFDSSLRTISNLLVDQTLGNPAAVLTALQRAGSANQMADLAAVTAIYQTFKPASDAEYQARVVMQNAKIAADELGDGDPLSPPTPEEQAALDALAAATAVHTGTVADLEEARVVRDAALEPFGIAMQGDNVHLPNAAPDEGLSAPFNSWFTLFGQFFDHGLDLVNKGGSGTVFIPLQPDDPLYVPGSHTNFMVLTRATTSPGADGVFGNDPATPQDESADDVRPVNTTTAYVDQNQTYTSHASHQVFLRQYVLNAAGDPVATGKLIEGANGGMATWGEVKAQAKAMLGIDLTDFDVGSVPLLRTDAYGNFIPNADGFPQIITGIGVDGIPNTADDVVVSGTVAAPVNPTTVLALRTGHAFLADIAHEAVPVGKIADGDITIGLANPGNGDTEYDNELLDAHFIAGDGRVNENIGLTAVHHVFHAEHNRLVEHTKAVILATGDNAFIQEWLVPGANAADGVSALEWDGERLFQAAKFGTEMQYQHLVFEEFARKVQPNINVFVVPDGFDTTIDPSIVAEFAHVVYRFGHSMLTESIDRFDPAFAENHIGLIEGFLNPVQFDSNHAITDDIAAGAIVRGMTRQVGNEIDEFVTTALRNNLLGLPLDLATINLARGRDTGVPSLNAARSTFYEATNQDVLLKPYESWTDFAGHLKHEASIINFIAAYGTHSLITSQTTLEGKRDAALTLITGVAVGGIVIPPGDFEADRLAFLNATDSYAGGSLGGLNNVDLWIGGLAEEIMPFGGMLGSTFNFVFEVQMEKLQNGDRFYYLQRLDGLHLFGEMENNSFAAMIMRNTDATHLPSDVFSTPGLILEVDKTKQYNPDTGVFLPGLDGVLGDNPLTLDVDESADDVMDTSADPVGDGLLTQLVVRNNPATVGPDTNYLRYTGDDHVLLGGTNTNDILIASIGDDTLFGDGGADYLEGGFGNDIINGGAGDDIIKDSGGDDNIKAGEGNDVVHAGPGLDLVMGGPGQDFIFLGTDMGSEVFAGEGNDFIYGHKNAERILGNEGNDWIETGTFDGAPGDNFDEIYAQDGVSGHDVFLGDGGFDEFIAEGGDDIMVGSMGRGKMVGMSGFDWATYKDFTFGVDADFTRGIVFDENPQPPLFGTQDAYEAVEGLSGSSHNDSLTGSDVIAEERLPFAQGGTEGYRGSALDAAGIARIAGLQAVLGAGVTAYSAGEIILGGDGSDAIMGRGGDDIIDGDKWLDVQIGVFAASDINHTGTPLALHDSMTSLANAMFNGSINPSQLSIVRTIRTDATAGDIDIAQFQGLQSEYTFVGNADGSIQVTHAIADQLDGSDKLWNIERLKFADGEVGLIVGTNAGETLNGTAGNDLILGLGGNDTLNGLGGNDILVGGEGSDTLNGGEGNDILVGGPNGASAGGTFIDNFDGAASYTDNNGTLTFNGGWTETGDGVSSPTAGDVNINNGRLRFQEGTDGDEIITRSANLSSYTSATLTFAWEADDLDAGETVRVEAFNGTAWELLATLGGDQTGNFSMALTAAQIGAHTSIRFVTTGTFDTGAGNTGENFFVDNFTITASAVETLNGGNGDDTYSFTFGDGNDVINELANGGSADRISIISPTIDPVSLLPVITSLNAADTNTGTQNGNLVITYEGQQITVSGHYAGTNAQTGVERINFNDATYNGYLLGLDDYFISRSDPANRDAGGVNMSTNAVTNAQQNFIAGEDGVNDEITGGALNDLIFGGTGDNDLIGGDGDDLLVGGSGAGDDDLLDGGLGADTMIGLAGNDDYVVDDLLDVVVEVAGAGTDEVLTEMAALSIENMANVENLTYTGIDADQFVGTGNSLANVISGGDLADTLSGLGGNDTLQGGLGADAMTGGDGNDVYVVDETGDVVTEANADLLIGGTDRVESDIDYTLGANVENLDLNGTAIGGSGNTLNNVINGNGENNQLFGAGGNDTLNGNDGDDLIDGGTGDDNINGGNNNDIVIGGDGNDTINVGNGNDLIRYNATGFGADIITNFDATGGSIANQDLIDLSALGVTTANFANRVFEGTTVGGNTTFTIRENGAASAVQGTIQINNVNNAALDITDFNLAAAAPVTTINGNNTSQTLNGGVGAETINALGGNDTVNANGGNDVVNGGEGADILNGGDGNDTLTGGTGSDVGTYADNFNSQAYNNSDGTVPWTTSWIEAGDTTGTSATNGVIQIIGGATDNLRFGGSTADTNGATLTRGVNLAGATSARLSYTANPDNLDAGEELTVWFAANGTTFVQIDTVTGTNAVTRDFALTGTLGANSAIQFRVTGVNNANEIISVDSVAVTATIPGLNSGVDILNGDAGDDTIIWNANLSGATDGRDIVNGGAEGALGDTFVVNGNASSEWYHIYTRAEAATAGFASAATTEIVITRALAVDGPQQVIAELSEIEEIRINGVDPAGAGGGAGAGDTFTVHGDFSTTSLRLNTITIDGDEGDDTIDISALTSAHRIVFKSNGGNDTIIGALQAEDVIELPEGADLSTYQLVENQNGTRTISNGTHSVTFTGVVPPQFLTDEPGDDDEDDTETPPDDSDDEETAVTGAIRTGTAQSDTLIGTSGDDNIVAFAGDDVAMGNAGADAISAGEGGDFVSGGAGRDVIFAGAGDDQVLAGADNDIVYGDAGADRIFGDQGNDLINAGAGDDTVFGGAGDDLIVAEVGDGNDVYFGDEGGGGTGIDTLDMSAATANVTVNLGSGALSNGTASSSQTGNDTIWGIENVNTGSGNDTITASNAVNVMNGGAGDDTFKFTSTSAANGDTIVTFEPGDRIDLTGIDANIGTAGDQSFTLVTGAPTAAGQLGVTFETRAEGDVTVVQGNIDGNADADFTIEIAGHQNLTNANLGL